MRNIQAAAAAAADSADAAHRAIAAKAASDPGALTFYDLHKLGQPVILAEALFSGHKTKYRRLTEEEDAAYGGGKRVRVQALSPPVRGTVAGLVEGGRQVVSALQGHLRELPENSHIAGLIAKEAAHMAWVFGVVEPAEPAPEEEGPGGEELEEDEEDEDEDGRGSRLTSIPDCIKESLGAGGMFDLRRRSGGSGA